MGNRVLGDFSDALLPWLCISVDYFFLLFLWGFLT